MLFNWLRLTDQQCIAHLNVLRTQPKKTRIDESLLEWYFELAVVQISGRTVNKVVARFNDGRLLRGITFDFDPSRDHFHVIQAGAAPGTKPADVQLADLKAVFFVKDFEGDPKHEERKEFDPNKPPLGRKIRVVFKDGETLVGVTPGYQSGRAGFFLLPADKESNAERCYVVAGSAQSIIFT